MSKPKQPPKSDPRRIAVYARKSKITESGKSIEIQKEKCIALACAQFDVSAEDILIYEDEGKSGFYADRPQYKAMLRDIEQNKIRAVICYKIDRISRHTVDLLNLVQQMEQKGIAFTSVSDRDLDTSTRTGKIMISLLSAIAEFERDIIAERITDNMYELAKEGRWLGGECPLGYRSQKEKQLIGDRKKNIFHLEPVAEEQIAVRRLFELFLQTSTLTGTASSMNNEGYKTKKDKAFTLTAVRNILQNPVYAIADADMQSYFKAFDVPIWADDNDFDGEHGMMVYNKTEQTKELDADSRPLEPKYTKKSARRDIADWVVSVGKHRGIISGMDWVRVQGIIAEISQNQSARPKEVSKALLSGLVRCAECGSPMHVRAESGRRNADGSLRYRYICRDKRNKELGCTASKDMAGYDLDNYVVDQVCSMTTTDNTYYAELLNVKNILLHKSQETEKELNTLKKRQLQIENETRGQISNLRTAPDSIKGALYADIERLHQEQESNQERIDSIYEERNSQDEQLADIEKAKQTIMEFPKLVKLVDYEAKLRLLRGILECVIVKDGLVHIFLKGTKPNDFFVKSQKRSDVCHTETDSIFNTP